MVRHVPLAKRLRRFPTSFHEAAANAGEQRAIQPLI